MGVTAKVAVDDLKGIASAVAHLLGERQPPLLPGKAAVAQLAGMLDQWQPSHHALPRHPG